MAGQVSATSWQQYGPHLRVYRSDGATITERAYDGNWYTGAFSAQGVTVGATSWFEGGDQIHIRVYVGGGSEGPITEYGWDGGYWYPGSFTANGAEADAVSWFDGQTHIRVYVRDMDNKVTEQCWDGNGWYTGSYTD